LGIFQVSALEAVEVIEYSLPLCLKYLIDLGWYFGDYIVL
jgi:hypothetical protein